MLNNLQEATLRAVAGRRGAVLQRFYRNKIGYITVKRVVRGCTARLHLMLNGQLIINLRVTRNAQRRNAAACRRAIDRFSQCFDPALDHLYFWYDDKGIEHATAADDPGVTQDRFCVDVTGRDADAILDMLARVDVALP